MVCTRKRKGITQQNAPSFFANASLKQSPSFSRVAPQNTALHPDLAQATQQHHTSSQITSMTLAAHTRSNPDSVRTKFQEQNHRHDTKFIGLIEINGQKKTTKIYFPLKNPNIFVINIPISRNFYIGKIVCNEKCKHDLGRDFFSIVTRKNYILHPSGFESRLYRKGNWHEDREGIQFGWY